MSSSFLEDIQSLVFSLFALECAMRFDLRRVRVSESVCAVCSQPAVQDVDRDIAARWKP